MNPNFFIYFMLKFWIKTCFLLKKLEVGYRNLIELIIGGQSVNF